MPPAPNELDPNKRADDQIIRENETRARGFVEFPKMLYRTDGSQLTVNSRSEEAEALRAGDVHPTPADAIAEKAKRDERDRQSDALKVGEESARVADLDAQEAAIAEREKALEGAAKKGSGKGSKAADPPATE